MSYSPWSFDSLPFAVQEPNDSTFESKKLDISPEELDSAFFSLLPGLSTPSSNGNASPQSGVSYNPTSNASSPSGLVYQDSAFLNDQSSYYNPPVSNTSWNYSPYIEENPFDGKDAMHSLENMPHDLPFQKFPSIDTLPEPTQVKKQRKKITNKRVECKWAGCTKTFNRDADLMRHLKTIHVSPRSYTCYVDGCGKVCNRRDNLIEHVKSHKKT